MKQMKPAALSAASIKPRRKYDATFIAGEGNKMAMRWYQVAAGNRHRAFSFDETMKCEHHPCSQRQAPVAVPELRR
jgi:hypothetical protein